MSERIGGIRARIDYRAQSPSNEIGCILLAQPTFFQPDEWVTGPHDWPPANLRHKRYDLTAGEGLRIWEECLARTRPRHQDPPATQPMLVREDPPRYGTPQLVAPRLGQGIFRVAVMDAYGRACAATQEHSLPALEASHIQPYAKDGPHDVRNGVLASCRSTPAVRSGLRDDYAGVPDRGQSTAQGGLSKRPIVLPAARSLSVRSRVGGRCAERRTTCAGITNESIAGHSLSGAYAQMLRVASRTASALFTLATTRLRFHLRVTDRPSNAVAGRLPAYTGSRQSKCQHALGVVDRHDSG